MAGVFMFLSAFQFVLCIVAAVLLDSYLTYVFSVLSIACTSSMVVVLFSTTGEIRTDTLSEIRDEMARDVRHVSAKAAEIVRTVGFDLAAHFRLEAAQALRQVDLDEHERASSLAIVEGGIREVQL